MAELDDRKAKALAYQNDEVVASFRKTYGVSLEAAQELFEETKKFLWLCGTRPRELRMTVFGPMRLLDEMWHTFILFTREYTAYCDEHFGTYIHHAPTTRADVAQHKARIAEDPAAAAATLRKERRDMMLLLGDEFGEATLRRWFGDYAERYSEKRLRGLLVRHLPIEAVAHA